MARAQPILKMSPAEFEAFALRAENRDRKLQLIVGEVVEVVSNERSTAVSMVLAGELYAYLKHNRIGYLTDAQGGFAIGENRLIPDIGFVPHTTSQVPRDGVFLNGLGLAIEVLSPTDRDADIADKVFQYTNHGVEVWVVDPAQALVTIYQPNGHSQRLRGGDVITGDPLLPNLNLAIDDVFAWLEPPTA